MKKINYSFILLLVCITVFLLSQTYSFSPKTGDKELDMRLNEINSAALSDVNYFVERTSDVYIVDPEKIKEMLFIMEPADILICFQIQNITEYSLGEVIEYYRANKNDSWSNILTHFGINKISYEYVELKKIKDFYEPSYNIKNISKVR